MAEPIRRPAEDIGSIARALIARAPNRPRADVIWDALSWDDGPSLLRYGSLNE